MEPIYKEKSVKRPYIPLKETTSESIELKELKNVLQEVFRTNKTYRPTANTKDNMTLYLDPDTNTYVINNTTNDEQSVKTFQKEYIRQIKKRFKNESGYLHINETIFGILSDNDKPNGPVRCTLSKQEAHRYFIDSIPMDQQLVLCCLMVDEIVPKIVYITPILN